MRRKEDWYVGRMFGEFAREERERAVKEGEKRGEKAGVKKTAERTALRMLRRGEGVERIREYSGLSRARIEKLRRSVQDKAPA